ncbi:SdpI family protein [Kibdelosporangium philippinense]|uniref:SdpI family protein n=1 Tax=Kibdelosporangium philippinense TaxID=211113 RepID=A0ABS8ZH00_9PSEU|nr:SdpI family protein [Kibdelosporangium philippinense]MCE7005112.1 SdpI family protein [Kibdelosporangium philippinense]
MDGALVVAVILVVAGLAVSVTGVLAFLERLPLNRYAGVRTTASMRDAETFRVANKVAGLPFVVAGLVGLLGGVLTLVLQTGGVVALLVSLGGMIMIAMAGGLLGHKAALAVPEPEPELPAGCAGCACGNCGVAKLRG